jgi:hypothetical protein
MDGPSRKLTIRVQRSYVPNRLSEQTLFGVYERLLQVLTNDTGRKEQVLESTCSDLLPISTTGGPL